MKLLNEHWNGFRSSLSLVDAYKTLYRSLELQIKIAASCSHIVSRLCRPHLATAQVGPLLEEPEAHLKTLLLMLSLEKQRLQQAPLQCLLGELLTPRAEPELPYLRLFILCGAWWVEPQQVLPQSSGHALSSPVCFRKHLLFLISVHAWENGISSTNLCT